MWSAMLIDSESLGLTCRLAAKSESVSEFRKGPTDGVASETGPSIAANSLITAAPHPQAQNMVSRYHTT